MRKGHHNISQQPALGPFQKQNWKNFWGKECIWVSLSAYIAIYQTLTISFQRNRPSQKFSSHRLNTDSQFLKDPALSKVVLSKKADFPSTCQRDQNKNQIPRILFCSIDFVFSPFASVTVSWPRLLKTPWRDTAYGAGLSFWKHCDVMLHMELDLTAENTAMWYGAGLDCWKHYNVIPYIYRAGLDCWKYYNEILHMELDLTVENTAMWYCIQSWTGLLKTLLCDTIYGAGLDWRKHCAVYRWPNNFLHLVSFHRLRKHRHLVPDQYQRGNGCNSGWAPRFKQLFSFRYKIKRHWKLHQHTNSLVAYA